jgi:hypothetical protein
LLSAKLCRCNPNRAKRASSVTSGPSVAIGTRLKSVLPMFKMTISAPTQPFQISLGRVAIVYPFQETMSWPTNEIKARAKLPSMPFPYYLVTLLILLPFILFRKHSGLVRHNLCGARRRVKWHVRKCAGRWAFLHRKSHLRHSLIPKFFVRGAPSALGSGCALNGSA